MTRVDTSRSAVMSRVRHVDLTAASIEMDGLIAAVREEEAAKWADYISRRDDDEQANLNALRARARDALLAVREHAVGMCVEMGGRLRSMREPYGVAAADACRDKIQSAPWPEAAREFIEGSR